MDFRSCPVIADVIRLSTTAMNNDLARFVAEFRDVDFSYRDYIISGICLLYTSPSPRD